MIRIKNRITGLYDRKGMGKHWTDKKSSRGVWNTIGQAKCHVAQYISCSVNKEILKEYLDSDFIIIDEDNGCIEDVPVSEYLLPKIVDYIKKHKPYKTCENDIEVCEKLLAEYHRFE